MLQFGSVRFLGPEPDRNTLTSWLPHHLLGETSVYWWRTGD